MADTQIPLKTADEQQHPEPEQRVEKTFNVQPIIRRLFHVKSKLARQFLSEVLATFMLVTFGCASVAQFKFMGRKNGDHSKAPFLSVNFGFGIGVTLGVLVGGKVSGAHMNPAVSLAMLMTGRMTILQFFVYLFGQAIGAFLAAVVVFLIYVEGIGQFAKDHDVDFYSANTAGIFATYPSGDHISHWTGFADQFFATAFLIIVVLAVTDKKNVEIPHGTAGILLGLTIFVIGISFGHNCGYAVNPMRDFSPRLFTAIAGWGTLPFTAGRCFFWIPIVAPMIGSIFGTLVYIMLISNNWPLEL